MGDKDILSNAVNGSHDFHQLKLDQQEDVLVSGIAKDMETTIQKTHDEEIQRNRTFIAEAMAFLDKAMADIHHAEENAY